MHRTEPKRFSLRGRLLALLLLASVGVWIVGGWLIYVESRQLGERLSDEALKETGTLLLQLAQHEIAEHGLSLGVLLLRNEALPAKNAFDYQIWTDDSRSAYRSAGSPERPFLPLNAVGYGSTEVGGQPWRTYAVWNESHSLQIQIAQSVDYSRGMARNIALRLTATLSLLLIATAALIGWIVSRTMRPLLTTTEAVAARSPEDLSSVEEGGAPAEVLPLVQATNRLLKRVREALQQERRFTADAAHELRTPLAAVRANAQVICNARSPAEMTEAASDLMISVDRGSRVIDQLLALARADAQSSGAADMVELADLVESQCELQVPEASAGEVRLQAEAEPCEVMGHVDLLSVMLRNLIDNAIRYSPSGATVRVACHRSNGGAVLTVTDDGPGIPVDERERVFDRFHRLQTTRRPGSGLGLSIVRRIAELHGATVSIGDGVGGAAGQGTTVTVRFSAEKNQGEEGGLSN